jgi:hypothetical protein
MTLNETIEFLIENGTEDELSMLKSYLDGVRFLREASEILEEDTLVEDTLVEEFTDAQLAGILYENGYAVDDRAIQALREDIETGAVIIGPDIPDGKGGKDAAEASGDIDNADIDKYTGAETSEDLKAVVVEAYNALFGE